MTGNADRSGWSRGGFWRARDCTLVMPPDFASLAVTAIAAPPARAGDAAAADAPAAVAAAGFGAGLRPAPPPPSVVERHHTGNIRDGGGGQWPVDGKTTPVTAPS